MFAALLSAVLAVSQAADAAPIVCEDVELISVAHYDGGGTVVVFLVFPSEKPRRLTFRYWDDSMAFSRQGNRLALFFRDDCDQCYRLVSTPAVVESWEMLNPVHDEQPWFAQWFDPGLKRPK